MVELPQVVSPTVEAIYRLHEDRHHNQREERAYLGLSVIGEECERKLWYLFRWAAHPEAFDGRMLRLFETGHREEDRMVAELSAIGVNVAAVDPDTGQQWAVSAVRGHLRGHLDGVILSGVAEAPKARHVLECKTHNAKSFKALLKAGVAIAKPVHHAQMQGYMHLTGIDRALYLAVEKDTDALHVERIHYDPNEGLRIIAKAERVIAADRPPARLHEDPESKAAWACAYCVASSQCHRGAFSRTHCRTCLHASPTDDGCWHCARFDRTITIEEQRTGCPAHLFIPDLVPGEQVDVDPNAETVTYRMVDGTTWTDGGKDRW